VSLEGSEVTERPLSVPARGARGRGVRGATSQAAPSSPRGARSATALGGAFSATPTCPGSHSGMVRSAASPEGTRVGRAARPRRVQTQPVRAPDACASARCCRGRPMPARPGDDEVAARQRNEQRGPSRKNQRGPITPCPRERNHHGHDGYRGHDVSSRDADASTPLDRPSVQSADDLRRIEHRAPGDDKGQTGEQDTHVRTCVIAGAHSAAPNSQRSDDA